MHFLLEFINNYYCQVDGEKTLFADFEQFNEEFSLGWTRKKMKGLLMDLRIPFGRAMGGNLYIGNLVHKNVPRPKRRFVQRDVRLMLETV